MKKKLVFIPILLIFANQVFATTIRVPSESHSNIQSAIDAANAGDTVLVANGIYQGEGNVFLTIRGKTIVVRSENGADHCIIDCQGIPKGEVFQLVHEESRETVIEGFTFRNANIALFIENASPVIRNNVFEHDTCGIYCGPNSNPLIENNTFSQNIYSGIVCSESSPVIRNNRISNNLFLGIRSLANSEPQIEGNIISDNEASGISISESTGIIRNNTITANEYNGIYCVGHSSPLIENNDISQNGWPGIYCENASPVIRGNELMGNSVGIYCEQNSNSVIENNIISHHKQPGIYCNESSPVIHKNQILHNLNTGIVCRNAAPLISSNVISNNGGSRFSDVMTGSYDRYNRPYEVFISGRSEYGGIALFETSTPDIRNNIIHSNKGMEAGAIFSDLNSAGIIINNHIIGNASIKGGSVRIRGNSSRVLNNIIAFSSNSDADAGISRWYKDDLFIRHTYEGGKLSYVTYYFGFVNNGAPAEVTIAGCTGLNKTVWAEQGERFWIEARSNVTQHGDGGGLKATISSDAGGFLIEYKRDAYLGGCLVILSPIVTSYGTSQQEMAGAGIIVTSHQDLPVLAYNNVFGHSGAAYVSLAASDAKNDTPFDLTGIDGNISLNPLLDSLTYELLKGSPCIDAGTPDMSDMTAEDVDFAGNPRIIDGTGSGSAIIDIGAFEYQLTVTRITEHISICEGDEYEGWTEPGEYQRTLVASNGKDSIVTTHLTLFPAFKPSFTVHGDTLISDTEYVAYQWCDCNGEMAGKTDRYFVIDHSGEYHLLATNEYSCTYASDTIFVEVTNVHIDEDNGWNYAVIPNPNNGIFGFMTGKDPPERFTLMLINTMGKVFEIREVENPIANHIEFFDLQSLGKGAYFLITYSKLFNYTHKIIVY